MITADASSLILQHTYRPLFALCAWPVGPLLVKILFILQGPDRLLPLLFNFLLDFVHPTPFVPQWLFVLLFITHLILPFIRAGYVSVCFTHRSTDLALFVFISFLASTCTSRFS